MLSTVKGIKKWLGSNRALSTWYHRWRLNREVEKRGDVILVYQMGKVASTAIVETLHAARPNLSVFHVHFLTDAGIHDAKNRLKRLNKRFNANFWCLYESEFVRRNVLTADFNRNVKVVTLFREPIARTISSFFYNLNQYVPDFDQYRVEDPCFMEELTRRFLEDFVEHDYSVTWFDSELKRTFGVDVFQHEFNPDKGYAILKNAAVDVLVLKLEKLKDCAQVAFREFLGIPHFDLSSANTSEEQTYSELYKKFLNEVKLPESYLDRLYGSAYMTHFYSADEIARYRRKWKRG
jgi:hypothetical protein